MKVRRWPEHKPLRCGSGGRIQACTLTSDGDFGEHFAAASAVAGHALVASSVVSRGQVDLEVAAVNYGPGGQACVQPGPGVGQGRGTVGQTLQPDDLADPDGHVVGQQSGVRERWREGRSAPKVNDEFDF